MIGNTILAGNTANGVLKNYAADPAEGTLPPLTSNGFNLSDDAPAGLTGTGDITNSTTVKLGPLADNGGPTFTMALLEGSAAVNTGNPNFASPPDFDQRGTGFPRVKSGRLDIGAFESDFATTEISINDATITEGNSGTRTATFTVTLSDASTQAVTVKFATADGSTNPATAGTDYTAKALTTLNFAPGETSKTIGITIIGDTIIEPDETFFVNLSAPANATIADGQGVGTIVNDDLPTLSINDVNVLEGNSVNFTVTLSAVSAQAVTVNYATANGSATAPGDYTTKTGTVTIPAGQTRGIVNIVTVGDTLDELNETFFVNLSAPTNATVADTQGRGIIIDNDNAPAVTINDATVTEGDTGTKDATFTIALSAASGQTISINAIPSNGSARSPFDYVTGGARLIFTPGETSKTFSVPVKGDLLDEPDETFFVILSQAVNCSVGRGRGLGTIVDNDAAPSISIDDVRIGEGKIGQRTAAFRLKLSAPAGQVVRVSYATAGGTATPGVDYVAVPATQIAFTTGNLYAYARVLINGDALNEPDETFNVNLTAPQNATIADAQALGTILNDDTAPALSINDVSIAEGNSGTKNLTFTVTLSAPSGQTVTVNYATADGVARSTSDYTAKSGKLTFTAGQTSKTVSVVIKGDTTVEANETLFVLLSGNVNASISKARGVGTIINDDASG